MEYKSFDKEKVGSQGVELSSQPQVGVGEADNTELNQHPSLLATCCQFVTRSPQHSACFTLFAVVALGLAVSVPLAYKQTNSSASAAPTFDNPLSNGLDVEQWTLIDIAIDPSTVSFAQWMSPVYAPQLNIPLISPTLSV